MKEVDHMATEFNPSNTNRPVTFNLPDDDQVQLVPWGYILERVNANLETTLGYLTSENKYLTDIDNKLSEWLDGE